ncbi:MAG TPA: hypothetical protein VFP59_03170 [Candidatus Angelobacter sp.]|nr:hypothetical protein [Candidatus Angelobacter sp.]
MGVVDNVKEVADIVQKMGNIELYRKIVHLEGAVMDLTRELRGRRSELENSMRCFGLRIT